MKNARYLTTDRRRELCASNIDVETENGILSCVVSGAKNEFAGVTHRESGRRWEYSWLTVDRCDREGKPLQT